MSDFPPEFGAPQQKTISWHSPADVLPHVATLSGIEYLRGVSEGRIPPPPMGAWTITALPVVADGEVVLHTRSFVTDAPGSREALAARLRLERGGVGGVY